MRNITKARELKPISDELLKKYGSLTTREMLWELAALLHNTPPSQTPNTLGKTQKLFSVLEQEMEKVKGRLDLLEELCDKIKEKHNSLARTVQGGVKNASSHTKGTRKSTQEG